MGPIGFSDLSVAGKGFEASGNVGILDLVAGLKWVHNNIGQFGGDPDNVTIIGQSGGGSKVCTLVAMPETQGLIHKAIALSGNSTDAIDKNYSAAVGKVILQEAGLKPSEANKLQQMPWLDYIELANRSPQQLRSYRRRYTYSYGRIFYQSLSPLGQHPNDFLHYQLRIFPES